MDHWIKQVVASGTSHCSFFGDFSALTLSPIISPTTTYPSTAVEFHDWKVRILPVGKSVHILIGPKGAGKSHIGELAEARLGIPFLQVDDIALRVYDDKHPTQENYLAVLFGAIEDAVRGALKTSDAIIFESLGLTRPFDRMLSNLKQDFTVQLISVRASAATCMTRSRNSASEHPEPFQEETVTELNKIVAGTNHDFAAEIVNDDASDKEIVEAIRSTIPPRRPRRQP
jgi:shikimate kinase